MKANYFYSLMILFVLGCYTSLSALTPNELMKNKVQRDSAVIGKTLYENSCARCHSLKDPAKYTMHQWPGLVDKMQKRAKITNEQKAIILTYLATKTKK
jgi:cytochrome c2